MTVTRRPVRAVDPLDELRRRLAHYDREIRRHAVEGTGGVFMRRELSEGDGPLDVPRPISTTQVVLTEVRTPSADVALVLIADVEHTGSLHVVGPVTIDGPVTVAQLIAGEVNTVLQGLANVVGEPAEGDTLVFDADTATFVFAPGGSGGPHDHTQFLEANVDRLTVDDVAPSLPAVGDLWVDTSAEASGDHAHTTVATRTVTGPATLVASDAGRVVEVNGGALTIPVGLPEGAVVEVTQVSASAVTMTAGAGVVLRPTSTVTLAGQWATAGLRHRGGDEWVASGDLA